MSSEDNSNGNFCTGPTPSAANTTMGSVGGLLKPTSSSTEDLSEYTDADESISAPTEFLAEFLSAVMLKDYETAAKYCKLILQYEPNNITAKEFYPLILEKLQNTYNKYGGAPHPAAPSPTDSSNGSSESGDSSSSSEAEVEGDGTSSSDSSAEEEEEEEEAEGEDEDASGEGEGGKRCSSDGDATTASYSSLEDEEAEQDQLSNLAAKYRVDNVDLGNGNKIICFPGNHQGSNWEPKGMSSTGPGIVPFGTNSDSESPTEPVSQQAIAMLRAKVVPPKH